MPGPRKGRGQTPKSQGVKSVERETNRINKAVKKLLQKAGKDVRQVRHEVSVLKKAGLASPRIDVRKYKPTRYMLSKLKENADILSGEAVTIKAPKKVRDKYVQKGIYEQRGSRLVVPREYANQRTRISRGMVEVSRPLSNGEEIRLILPYRATDLEDLMQKMRDNPNTESMKQPGELFGFRLFGHNMATIGFPDFDHLYDYVMSRYSHLFSGKSGREGVKHFELLRFKSKHSQLSEVEEGSAIYSPRRKKESNERDWIANKRRQRDALRKKKLRQNETDEEYEKRLEEQRLRQARLRQRKFYEGK